MQINPVIFRGYDLRGLAGSELNEDVYYTLGRAYATFLTKRRITLCPVGRDNRETSEDYTLSFIRGLNDGGIDTYDLGYSLSQMVYFSSYAYLTKACAMITASHNPKEYNGLKLGVGYSDTMVTSEIQELKEIANRGEFSTGQGTNIKKDLYPQYRDFINHYFHLEKKWKIVIDTGHSSSGLFYPDLFRHAGCEVIEQNCDLDSSFPLGAPDPTESKLLERLAEGVRTHQADLGFAYDADGDRMAVVDHTGQVLWMDIIVALFAEDVLSTAKGSTIIFNNLCSRVVTETVLNNGGVPLMWKTGHSFIKAKLKEVRAPFAGELSGHIFFMDNFFGHDDAAYASLRLLSFLEKTQQSLHNAVSALPQYFSSPEIKIGVPENHKFSLIDQKIKPELIKLLPDAQINEVDGVRLDSTETMIVVRASQNGPYLTLKFESKTAGQYRDLKAKLKNLLQSFPELDWQTGTNLEALD